MSAVLLFLASLVERPLLKDPPYSFDFEEPPRNLDSPLHWPGEVLTLMMSGLCYLPSPQRDMAVVVQGPHGGCLASWVSEAMMRTIVADMMGSPGTPSTTPYPRNLFATTADDRVGVLVVTETNYYSCRVAVGKARVAVPPA